MSRMDSQLEVISERMQALEELIKKTIAHKHEMGDCKAESEVDGDSDESDSSNIQTLLL